MQNPGGRVAVEVTAERLLQASPERRVDLRGETCPTTSDVTLRVLEEMAPGEVLEVTSDYYPARSTLPYHCERRGYRYAFADDPATAADSSTRPVWRLRIQRT